VLSLAMILAVVRFDLGVVGMVAAFMLAPMVASWVAGALLWSRNAYLRFSRRQLDRRQMRALLGTGAQFFFVQLAFALCFASDNLIIARTLSVEDVTTYAVHQKLFSPISMVVGFVVMPLWPAFGEAIARGDTTWVRRVLRRSALLLLSTAVIGSVVLLALAEPLFAVWLRGQVAPEMALCAALAVWMVVDATGKAYAMFLNGADLLRPQVWIAAVFVPVCIGLKILFAARWGVAGIPLAMAIAWIVTHAVPYALIIRRWNAQHAPQR
jgi:O-antigen/teichoic acid export membrane protein